MYRRYSWHWSCSLHSPAYSWSSEPVMRSGCTPWKISDTSSSVLLGLWMPMVLRPTAIAPELTRITSLPRLWRSVSSRTSFSILIRSMEPVSACVRDEDPTLTTILFLSFNRSLNVWLSILLSLFPYIECVYTFLRFNLQHLGLIDNANLYNFQENCIVLLHF